MMALRYLIVKGLFLEINLSDICLLYSFRTFSNVNIPSCFTSTEAEPDKTFRLNAFVNLSPGPEAGQGAVQGAELGPEGAWLEAWQSTVFCRGSRSLVSFSPMLAWRNQGSEIFRRVLPVLGGLLGLWVVAMAPSGDNLVLSGCLFHCYNGGGHAEGRGHSHDHRNALYFTLRLSHRVHYTLKAIFPASTKTFSPSTKCLGPGK